MSGINPVNTLAGRIDTGAIRPGKKIKVTSREGIDYKGIVESVDRDNGTIIISNGKDRQSLGGSTIINRLV